MHLGRIEAEVTPEVRTNRRSKRSRIQALSTLALAAVSLGAIAGCGNTYRPVVTSINPVGPAAQPQRFAVVISDPGAPLPGLVTIVDFSGDTVLVTANIGVQPQFLMLDALGATGYSLNGDKTMSSFDISTQLQTRDVALTTLLPDNDPKSPNSIFADATALFLTEPGRNAVAQLKSTPTPPSLNQEFAIDPNYSPVWIAGFSGSPRAYIVSQNKSGGPGEVSAIELSSSTISTKIDVGVNPVYGVMTSDGKRAFIMNKGDNTVSVINSQTNQLDVVPTLPAPGAVNPIPVGVAPVWADLAPTRNELVVVNEGDGTSKGSVSLINIPLCSTTALPGNPNCDPNNPIDANGFGQSLTKTPIPVGVDPQMVAVLQDGSRAYVINKGDSTVSVVNLTTNTVTATIPVPATPHPTFMAVINGTPTGKVYVTSPESDHMTIIRTDTDVVETTVPLQGKGIMVRAQLP